MRPKSTSRVVHWLVQLGLGGRGGGGVEFEPNYEDRFLNTKTELRHEWSKLKLYIVSPYRLGSVDSLCLGKDKKTKDDNDIT